MPEPVLLVQTLEGAWEELGVDRDAGIVPEDIQPAADRGGPSSLSLTLRRRRLDRPNLDLSAFTPAVLELDGRPVWSGMVRETPMSGGGGTGETAINVQGVGWQAHADEALTARLFAKTSLGDFRDTRTFLGVPLASWPQSMQVTTGGAVVLGLNGGTLTTPGYAGVTFDAGADSDRWIERAVIAYDSQGMSGNYSLRVRGHALEDPFASSGLLGENAASVNSPSSSSGFGGTFTQKWRYVSLILENGYPGGTIITADEWVRITKVLLVGDASWAGSNTDSALTATDVWLEAFDPVNVPLLSDDRSGIATTSFVIPELDLETPSTTRQASDRANDYHRYQIKVDVDRRPVIRPYPVTPLFEVKDSAYFDDTSANSAEEIVAGVLITGTGPTNENFRVQRNQGDTAGATGLPAAEVQAFNPSADVDASHWTFTGGPITRTTTAGEYDTGPGGIKAVSSVSSPLLTAEFTGTFRKGVSYRVSFRLKRTVGTQIQFQLDAGYGLVFAGTNIQTEAAGSTFQTYEIRWTPVEDFPADPGSPGGGVRLKIYGYPTTDTIFVDTLRVERMVATLAEKRGNRPMRTLQVQAPTNLGAMATLGDAYNLAHRSTPLRGNLRAERGVVTRYLGGGEIDPSELLLNTGELILFSTLVDPDTGELGRLGVIDSVGMNVDSDIATVSIDNRRDNLEALMARMAVVSR